MQNPLIDLDRIRDLTDDERALVTLIVGRDGRLRRSRPKLDRVVVDGRYQYPNPDQGRAIYVWRLVAFQVGTSPKDHCMPCTADFYLPGSYDEVRAERQRLDGLVERVVDSVPKDQWHGIRRWGNALGLLGEPRYAADGAVIYR